MVETKSVGVHYKTSFNQILRLPKIRAENKVYLIFGEVYQAKSQKPLILLGFRWVLASLLI